MPDRTENLLIFTDLDGTLLDHFSYDYTEALPAIAQLEQRHIPWIINSSKTFAEIIELRQTLGNQHPFIAENGAVIYIPRKLYQCWNGIGLMQALKTQADEAYPAWHKIILGKTCGQMRPFLDMAKKQFQFECLTELPDSDVMKLTGLSPAQAQKAKNRQFSEPLVWHDNDDALAALTTQAHAASLKVQRGGRFVHLMGQADKGVALTTLCALYQQQAPQTKLTSVALGDGENDVPMLLKANIAVFITSPVHPTPAYPSKFAPAQKTMISPHHGPRGWNSAVLEILSQQKSPFNQANLQYNA